jgi:hypothetical protein
VNSFTGVTIGIKAPDNSFPPYFPICEGGLNSQKSIEVKRAVITGADQ